MPALPFVPGVAKIIVKQTMGAVNVFNILHADGGPGLGWSASELTALATAVRAAWVTNILSLQSTALTLTDVQCIDLASDTGAQATVTGSNNGTAAGAYLAASSAVCWSWKISRRYRGGHPRTYIGGIPGTALSTANTLVAGTVTNHTNGATNLRAAINAVTTAAGSARLACVHYYKNNTLLTTPLVSEITGVSVDTRVDSQRRRLGPDR